MTQEKVNVNRVNWTVYEAMIRACFQDYTQSFNNMSEERRVVFNMTITSPTIKTYDVLLKQGKYKSVEEMEKLGIKNDDVIVKYLRVGKAFEKVKYSTPIAEQFKPGFVYQQLDVVNKVWEELQFAEGDIIPSVELDKDQIRVASVSREREITIYQQSMRLKDQKEVLNAKWWKRILYMDLLNTLMAKGVEYGEVLELMKRGEEEKAVLAKELGDNAKEVLEANKIVIRKEMPKPLSKGDKEYVEQIKKAKAKEEKK